MSADNPLSPPEGPAESAGQSEIPAAGSPGQSSDAEAVAPAPEPVPQAGWSPTGTSEQPTEEPATAGSVGAGSVGVGAATPTGPASMTLAYKGRRYALGYVEDHYGLWSLDSPNWGVLEQWPRTEAGWGNAWARFTELERAVAAPVATAGAPDLARGRRLVFVALALLVAGIGVGVASLFFRYLDGQSLTQDPSDLAAHAAYLGAWTVGVVMISRRGRLAQAGACLCLGLSLATFGLFVADGASALTLSDHESGIGVVIGIAGWALCAAGSVVAARAMALSGAFGQLRASRVGVAVFAVVAAFGTAITFAPPWDRFVLHAAATNQTNVVTAGNAFSNPGAVIAGDVIVMLMVALVPVVAIFWRPRVLAAGLSAGVVVPMAAQVLSALMQWREPTPPSAFGISNAQVATLRITITQGFTWVFYVYCAFVVALALVCSLIGREPRDRTSVGRADVIGS